jgi:hypothetical protein
MRGAIHPLPQYAVVASQLVKHRHNFTFTCTERTVISLTSEIYNDKVPVIAQSVQWLGYGLDDRGSRVRFPAGAGNFSFHHCVQNWGVKLTTQLHLVTRLGMRGAIRLHGVVLS